MTPTREPLDLEPIKKRMEAATPGPWDDAGLGWLVNYDIGAIAAFMPQDSEKRPDLDFCWNARQDIPALVSEVEALRLEKSIIKFPSDPPFNILNQPLTWLYTHCRAIGMTETSDPKTAEGDICLFTIRLKSEVEALMADAERLRTLCFDALVSWQSWELSKSPNEALMYQHHHRIAMMEIEKARQSK